MEGNECRRPSMVPFNCRALQFGGGMVGWEVWRERQTETETGKEGEEERETAQASPNCKCAS